MRDRPAFENNRKSLRRVIQLGETWIEVFFHHGQGRYCADAYSTGQEGIERSLIRFGDTPREAVKKAVAAIRIVRAKHRRFLDDPRTRHFFLKGGDIRVSWRKAEYETLPNQIHALVVGFRGTKRGFSYWIYSEDRRQLFKELRRSLAKRDPRVQAVNARINPRLVEFRTSAYRHSGQTIVGVLKGPIK